MVDATRVRSLLTRLHARVEELGPYATMEADAYLADKRSVHAEVDNQRVHDFLKDDVKDLDSFAAALLGAFSDLSDDD